MYIASKSQKKSSCATRFFGADVVFFRQTGRKQPNLAKNRGNLAKKQFANQINFHLYHYAGNNPVKYLDPDGREDCGLFNAYNGFDIAQFEHKVFTKDNPLNQLELDKALKIRSNSRITESCQTTAIINAYAAQNENGITGKQILDALTENGIKKNILGNTGYPSISINEISKNLAKACNLDKFLAASESKVTVTLLANLSEGAILGYSKKDGTRDKHFGYKDWTVTIDSLDPNRGAAKTYKENSLRILRWKAL